MGAVGRVMQNIQIEQSPDVVNALHDYLIDAVPGFHRVTTSEDGRNSGTDDCGRLHVKDGVIRIVFADDIPPRLIMDAAAKFRA